MSEVNIKEKKVSVIIPTLQKEVEILNKLIDSLNSDSAVSEIILIDNSAKGYKHSCKKLRVIEPNENIFVNPAWNLGVEEAKEDIVAILNDDIIISQNFCKNIINQISPDMGMVGYSRDFVDPIEDIEKTPKEESPIIKKTDYMDFNYGIAMFCYKTSYYEIPDEIKIVYGDNWLYSRNKLNKKNNYIILGQPIYHWGSLSSSQKALNPICANDAKIYKRLTVKWYNRLLSFDNVWDCYKIRILGLTFKIPKFQRKV